MLLHKTETMLRQKSEESAETVMSQFNFLTELYFRIHLNFYAIPITKIPIVVKLLFLFWLSKQVINPFFDWLSLKQLLGGSQYEDFGIF